MSTKKHSFERRTDKLRASCDACYLAKVKCSKSRPLCQRCLVSGTNCAYSPSARFKRGPKTGGGSQLNEDTVTFQIQQNNEAGHDFNPSLMFAEPFNYQGNNPLQRSNAGEQYPALDSSPCPRNWTSEPILYTEPVPILDGEAASEVYTNVNGFELSDPYSWWDNANASTSNVAETVLDSHNMRLEPSEMALSHSYSSWYQSPRSETNPLPFINPDMVYAAPQALAECELDHVSFNPTGEFPSSQLFQVMEPNNTFQYHYQGQ